MIPSKIAMYITDHKYYLPIIMRSSFELSLHAIWKLPYTQSDHWYSWPSRDNTSWEKLYRVSDWARFGGIRTEFIALYMKTMCSDTELWMTTPNVVHYPNKRGMCWYWFGCTGSWCWSILLVSWKSSFIATYESLKGKRSICKIICGNIYTKL